MIDLTIEEIKEIIRPCGLSPMKSKGIYGLSKIIIEKHNGVVPKTFEDLEELPRLIISHSSCYNKSVIHHFLY